MDVYEFFHPDPEKSGKGNLSNKEFEKKAKEAEAEMKRRKKERGR